MTKTTPFPDGLLDEAMPLFKDTEWRLLCVIVRQTLGWQEKGSTNRKVSDWLTQAQLVKKTGRDRAAISRAIDTLVQGGFIEVRDEKGKPLLSTSERRQCQGRLFFGLHPRLISSTLMDEPLTESEYQTPGSNSLLKRDKAKSEYPLAPKANTTKETLAKENVTRSSRRQFWKPRIDQTLGNETFDSAASGIDVYGSNQASPQITISAVGGDYSDEVPSFVVLFTQLCEQVQGRKADTRLSFAKATRLKIIFNSHPLPDWTQKYYQQQKNLML